MGVKPLCLIMHPMAQAWIAQHVPSETGSLKWGILELVFLLCWKGIQSHMCILPNVWCLWLQLCWGMRMAWWVNLASLLGSLMQSQAAHLSCTFCYQNKAAAMIVPPAMTQRGDLFWIFSIRIIRLLIEVPVLLALVMTGSAVVLEQWDWAGRGIEKPLN